MKIGIVILSGAMGEGRGKPIELDVLAFSNGPFAVHNAIYPDQGWSISHISTGWAIKTGYRNHTDAIEGMKRLLALGGDWDFSKASDMPTGTAEIGRAFVRSEMDLQEQTA